MSIEFDPVVSDPPVRDSEYPSSMTPIFFDSHGKKLLGTMLLTAGKGPHPTVLLLHGFPGNELNLDIAHAIKRAGFNVAIFHYRGSWGSEGDFSWQNCIEDTQIAVELLRSKKAAELFRVESNKIILAGHSLGGFLALYTLAQDKELKHGAFISGFNFGIWAELIRNDQSAKIISIEQMDIPSKILTGTSADALLSEMLERQNQFNLINYAEELAKKDLFMLGAKYDQLAVIEFHHAPLEDAIKKFNPQLKAKIMEAGHSFADKRIELTREVINWLHEIKF